MEATGRSLLLTITMVAIAIGSVLILTSGGVAAQTNTENNSTPTGIQQAHEKAQFAFETPTYIPGNLPFGAANVRNVGVSTVRLYWNTSDRSQRLSMHAYPSQNATLFRGNKGISGTENVTINGQRGDYSEPQTPNGTGTVTFVSESNVTYLVTGTYNRSTLLRVTRSIGQGPNVSNSSESTDITDVKALPNDLTIQSTGDKRAFYNITTSGRMLPGTGADFSGATFQDVIIAKSASGGTTEHGADNYTFRGNITAIDLRGGPAKVLVNGEQVDPDSYPNTPPTGVSTPSRTSTATNTPTVTPTSTSRSTTSTVRTTSAGLATPSTTTEDSSTNQTPSGTITGAQTIAESGNGSSGGSSGFGPGFGILPAVLALAAIVIAVARRR
jgi:hypothetical protein